jgi:hypothetical protein
MEVWDGISRPTRARLATKRSSFLSIVEQQQRRARQPASRPYTVCYSFLGLVSLSIECHAVVFHPSRVHCTGVYTVQPCTLYSRGEQIHHLSQLELGITAPGGRLFLNKFKACKISVL